MRRRRLPALALAMTLSLAMAACSGGDDDEDAAASTTTTTGPSTTAAPTTQPDLAAAADVVKIDELDYSYTVSGALKSGGTLEVANKGKEFHMLGLGKLVEGKTLDDLKAALERDETSEEDPTVGIIEQLGVPGNVMGPGQSVQITAPTLGAGKYALLCYINVEGENTAHFSKGMIGELTVVEDKAPEPQATATYKAEKGKAIEGPASLKAGRQVLRIESTGEGAGDLEPGLTKLNPGATPEDFSAAAKLFEEGPLPVGAPAKLPGAWVIGGFDLRDARVIYLAVDLEAGGSYYLTANDTDDDDDPAVPDEIIQLTVT